MFKEYKHVHFVGIGGIGMSALAKWFLHEGVRVSGSDLVLTDITSSLEAKGATIYSGHEKGHMADDVDLVIYSPAVPDTNPERVQASEKNIPQKTNFEVLGEISKSFSTIVVTGTNGKSTTTAMLGLILEAAGYDPTVLVGSLVPGFKEGNIRIGKGRFFVVEGCEYRANMLHFEPEMIVLTNIEEDHLDFYRDIKHIQETFQTFVDKLQGKGLTIFNATDPFTQDLTFPRGVGYGIAVETDYMGRNRKTAPAIQEMETYRKEDQETRLGDLQLHVPGKFNMLNALAATSAAMELGIPFETCARTLKEFNGIWRRFERVGRFKGAEVISDYGHHPSGIRETIQATREFFPDRRVVLCYQPHQHDRTKKLFDEFVEVLPLADELIVAEIYDVAGRNEEHNISSKHIVEQINKKNPEKDVHYAANLKEAEEKLSTVVKTDDIILIMGAGDIDHLARNII